ncbi:glycosyl transferase group 1 [mine drainage metagenome]|uniref:Glycosyl transferase group 1 n=1 Tax=mine drainage metagenome TaxID=410659 RepID=T1AY39_9ZZZZ
MVEEYNNASVLAFPSRFESFGVSLAEGQAYGLPAVAFDVRGPDVIMKNSMQGTLVAPFDVDVFASEINKYYKIWNSDKDSYLKLKRRISRIIIDRFGKDVILPKIEDMFLGESFGEK